jgi:outer membrane protein OmpA-like peptidoglycan-associated protein
MRRVTAAAATVAFLFSSSAAARQLIVDGDADGVDDTVDQCLYTPAAAPVDTRGCSQEGDEDADGVSDVVDACPYSPPQAQVDAHGCALDADFDGVANGLDRCSATALGVAADARGCAPDQAVNAAAPAVRPVRTLPAVAPAAASVPAPRPAPTPAIAAPPAAAPAEAAVLLRLSYTPGGAHLGQSGLKRLRAALPQLREALQQDARAVLVVEGYAQAEGDGAAPDTLARTRANRLRRLLADEGIDPLRLRSLGHAPQPAAAGALRKAEVALARE